jgi:hypothetical protein
MDSKPSTSTGETSGVEEITTIRITATRADVVKVIINVLTSIFPFHTGTFNLLTPIKIEWKKPGRLTRATIMKRLGADFVRDHIQSIIFTIDTQDAETRSVLDKYGIY